jgi:hypothetical protein
VNQPKCQSCEFWRDKSAPETFVFVGYGIDIDKAKEIVSIRYYTLTAKETRRIG